MHDVDVDGIGFGEVAELMPVVEHPGGFSVLGGNIKEGGDGSSEGGEDVAGDAVAFGRDAPEHGVVAGEGDGRHHRAGAPGDRAVLDHLIDVGGGGLLDGVGATPVDGDDDDHLYGFTLTWILDVSFGTFVF